MSHFRSQRREDAGGDDGRLRWDLSTVLLLATIIAIVLYITWEIWASHPFPE